MYWRYSNPGAKGLFQNVLDRALHLKTNKQNKQTDKKIALHVSEVFKQCWISL